MDGGDFEVGRWGRALSVLLVLALVPAAAVGQVGIAFEFSLANPGARSMGFGGAFVALADDATADFVTEAETQGLFAEGPGPLDTARLLERRDGTRLELVAYGLSGAFKILENLSLGFGLGYFENVLQGRQDRYLWDEDSLEGYFGPSSFLPERLDGESLFVADGSDIALNAGLLWRLDDNWSFGGFYRQGPSFELELSIVSGPANTDPETPPGSSFSADSPIDYPEVFGAGVAYRSSNGRLTLSFEWDRIEYSAIFDSLVLNSSGEFIADGDEYHLGAEYAFLGTRPLFALRGGLWRDPNHQVDSDLDSPIVGGLIGRGADELHYAVGFGVAFQRFQVDLGLDLSDRQDALSISGIYSW